MVGLDMVNDLAQSGGGMLLTGGVLTLVGVNHIQNPSGSLVAGLLPGLGNVVYQGAGVIVGAAGLGQLGRAGEMLGIY